MNHDHIHDDGGRGKWTICMEKGADIIIKR